MVERMAETSELLIANKSGAITERRQIVESFPSMPQRTPSQFEVSFNQYINLRNTNPTTLPPDQQAAYPTLLEQRRNEVNQFFAEAKESGLLLDVDEELDRIYDLVRYKFKSDPDSVSTILKIARGLERQPPGSRTSIKAEGDLEESYWILFGDEGIENWGNLQLRGARGVYYREGLRRIAQEFASEKGAVIPTEKLRLEEWEWNLDERRAIEPKMWEWTGYRIEFDRELVTNQETLQHAFRQYIRDNIGLLQADYRRMINETVRYLGDAVTDTGRRIGLSKREIQRNVLEAQGELQIPAVDHFARINQIEAVCGIMGESFCKDFTPERIEALNRAYDGKVWLAAVLLETDSSADGFKDYFQAEGLNGEYANKFLEQAYHKEKRKQALVRKIAMSALRNKKDLDKIMDEDANPNELFGDAPKASQLREIYRKIDEADERLKTNLKDEIDTEGLTAQERNERNLRQRMLEIEDNIQKLSSQGLVEDSPELEAQRNSLKQVQQQYDQLITQRFIDIEKEAGLTTEEKNLKGRAEEEAKEAVDMAINIFTALGWFADLGGPKVWINNKLMNIEDAVQLILDNDKNYKYRDKDGNAVVNYSYFIPFDDTARETLIGRNSSGELPDISELPKGVIQPVRRPKMLERLRQAIDPNGEIAAIDRPKDGLSENEQQRYALYDRQKAMRDAYFNAFYILRTNKGGAEIVPGVRLQRDGRNLTYAEAMVWGSGQPLAIKKLYYFPEYLLSQKRDYIWKEEYIPIAMASDIKVRSIIRELGFRTYKEFSASLGMVLPQNKAETKADDSYEVQRYYEDRLSASDLQRKRAFGGKIGEQLFTGYLISALKEAFKTRQLGTYNTDNQVIAEAVYSVLVGVLERPLEFARGFFMYENDRKYYGHDSITDGHWFLDRFMEWLLNDRGGKQVFPSELIKGDLGKALTEHRQFMGEEKNFSYFEEIKRREIK